MKAYSLHVDACCFCNLYLYPLSIASLLLLLCFFLHSLTSAKSYHSTTPLCFALRDLHVWQLPDYFPILMDLNWWRHRGLNHPISLSPDARDLGRNIRRCWCLIPEQTLGSRAIFVPSWLSMWWLWTYPPFTAGSANHFWELLKSVTKNRFPRSCRLRSS